MKNTYTIPNKELSKEALALSVTPGVVGYTPDEVTTLRNSDGLPARIKAIKSDALFALSADVVTTIRTGESAIAAQSVLLAKVLENNLFMTEGYKNFKEFAESVYGLNGGTAYTRAKVGSTIIGNTKIPADIKRMPISTLERMTTLSENELLSAIDTGKINSAMGQFEVRDAVKAIKTESASTKPSKAKTTFPINAEMYLNGEWSFLTANVTAEFNLKSIAAAMTGHEWTGMYTKFPGDVSDKSELHTIMENTDGAWYHVKFTKVVTRPSIDKTAKTLTPISAEEYAALVMKVATGELTMKEIQETFTVKVEA